MTLYLLRPARRIWGLAAASHPFPVAMVVTLTGVMGVASARGSLDGGRFALMLTAMLLNQLSIGWTNDYVDRDRDAVHQPDKPIPAGVVEARLVPPLVVIALVGLLAAGVALGPEALTLLAVGTAAGMVYNFGVKDTALSWLPYVVAFACVPPFVWLSLDVYRSELLWLYVIAPAFVVSMHLGQSLPDVESDPAVGRWGLAPRLGRQRALVVVFAGLALPPLLTAVSSAFVSYDAVRLSATLGVYAALVLAGALAYRRQPWERAADAGFRFLAVGAVLFIAGWLWAVGE